LTFDGNGKTLWTDQAQTLAATAMLSKSPSDDVQISSPFHGQTSDGDGVSHIVTASVKALISGVNRLGLVDARLVEPEVA